MHHTNRCTLFDNCVKNAIFLFFKVLFLREMASPGLYGASDGSGCCLFIRDLRSKYPNEAEQQTLFVDTKKQSNPYVYERDPLGWFWWLCPLHLTPPGRIKEGRAPVSPIILNETKTVLTPSLHFIYHHHEIIYHVQGVVEQQKEKEGSMSWIKLFDKELQVVVAAAAESNLRRGWKCYTISCLQNEYSFIL